jgi:NADH-quinone oxidoreductase subunit I
MVDGMEERDYYQGKVAKATAEQQRWVEQHEAKPEEGLAPTGDPVEGVDTLEHGRQATRDTTEGVRR